MKTIDVDYVLQLIDPFIDLAFVLLDGQCGETEIAAIRDLLEPPEPSAAVMQIEAKVEPLLCLLEKELMLGGCK